MAYTYKGSFCGLQNTPKCVCGQAAPPTQLGEFMTLPQTPSSLVGWGTHLNIPTPLRRLCSLVYDQSIV